MLVAKSGPDSAARQPRRVHWDALTADVQLSPTLLAAQRGSLRHGSATLLFDVSTGLKKFRFSDTSPFSARLNVHNAELADVESVARLAYPASGRLNLSLRAGGTWEEPRGE